MKFNFKKIREIRINVLKITQKQLAKETKLSLSYIQKLECGLRQKPSYEVVSKLADVLNINPAELFLNE